MKILCVVGIRASGKTTIVEELTKELRRRGKRVGTVKTVFCPSFSIDNPTSNTARHARAGAEIVTAKARNETAVLYQRPLTNAEILAHYVDMDYVLLEGDYRAPVPRIVAAHQAQDARERINEWTIAVSGRLANSAQELDGLPVVSPLRQIEELCDRVEACREQPVEALDELLAENPATSGGDFCQCGCHKHQRKLDEVTVSVGGKEISLTPEQEKIIRDWCK